MILVDANLLLYAGVREYPQHASAAAWLEERMNGTQAVGLPWPSLLAFLRLAVNPRIHEFPPTLGDAWRLVREWLDCDPVFIPGPGPRHHEILELGRGPEIPARTHRELAAPAAGAAPRSKRSTPSPANWWRRISQW